MEQTLNQLIDEANSLNRLTQTEKRIVNFLRLKLSDPRFKHNFIAECLYQLLDSTKKLFLRYRKEQWKSNFGVPSLAFSLYFERNSQRLKDAVISAKTVDLLAIQDSLNSTNNVELGLLEVINSRSDSSGSLVKTTNNQGYMTKALSDLFSKQFVDVAKHSNKPVSLLEIGAAYGVATLEALKYNQATVFCNDLGAEHLAVVENESHLGQYPGKFIPIVGRFPDEMMFESGAFDAVLISRVLHFFSGSDVIEAIKQVRSWLKPGGKLFIINETPYLSNWRSFLPEYERRKQAGLEWPGEITEPKRYEQSHSAMLPGFVHWFDDETLLHAVKGAGFDEEYVSIEYINREGVFPPEILMAEIGKESVGCCARR